MNDVMGTALFLVLMGIVWIADRTLRRDTAQREADAIAAMSDAELAHDRLNRAW